MADENNSQILQEINELLDQLKTFPQNRDEATDEQKQQIKEIWKQLFQKESYKYKNNLDEERQKIHSSDRYHTEKKEAFISVKPFFRLNELSKDKEQIPDKDREDATLCFSEIFNRIANDHQLSPEEKNILATYMPVFGAEAKSVFTTLTNQADVLEKLRDALAPADTAPQPMSEEDKTKVSNAFVAFKTRLPKINNDGYLMSKGSVKETKENIKKAVDSLSTSLAEISGEFTPEQIAEFEAIVSPLKKGNVKIKRTNTKTQQPEDHVLDDINIEKVLADKRKEKNKKAPTPAFTQLMSQLDPQYKQKKLKEELTAIFQAKLAEVHSKVTNPENAGNEINPDEPNANPDTPEAQDDSNAGQGQDWLDFVEDDLDFQPASMSEDEISQYLNEIRKSNSENAYLSNITPKIKPASIEAAMALKAKQITIEIDDTTETLEITTEAENRAIALSNPDDLLVTYDYFKETKKLLDVEKVIAASLQQIDPEKLNPDNAFVWLTLADKIKNRGEYQETYHNFTSALASAMQKYDRETFGHLPAETLATNLDIAEKDLKNLSPEFLKSLVSGYEFTDNSGKPLTDKNRGRLHPKRVFGYGKGNDRTDMLDSVFEAARLLAAQKLAKESMLENLKKNAPEQYQENLQSAMREAMAQILAVKDAPALRAGAKLLVQSLRELSEEEAMQKLLAGDKDAMNLVAAMQARQELGLPIDENPKFNNESDHRKYNNLLGDKLEALKNGQQKSTQFSKDELAGRLGGVMTAAEQFHIRVGQHFKDTQIDKKSNSLWHRVDNYLAQKLQKPYTEGKKYAKTLSKIAKKSAITMVATGLIVKGATLAGGPVGAAVASGAIAGYFAVKNIINVAKQWKQAESKKEKTALVIGAAISTGLSAAMTIAGISGSESALGQLSANLSQNIAGAIARAGITGVAVAAPNLIKAYSLNRKAKKLDEQIAKETDPNKQHDLIEKRKKLQIKRQKNNEQLISKGLGVMVGAGFGLAGTASAHGQNPESSSVQFETATENPAAQVTLSAATEQPTAAADSVASADSASVIHNHTAAAQLQQANLNESTPEHQTVTEQPETTQDSGNVPSPEAQAETNLNEAKTAGTGWRGQSSYDSAHNNLDEYKASLHMSDADVNATVENLSKMYGDDTYKVTHAALAEPRHLAAALGISDQDLSAQPGANPSEKMLSYLQSHDVSGNSGYSAYMETHFHTDQQLFTPTDRPAEFVHTTASQPQQPQETSGESFNAHPSGSRPENVTEVHLNDLSAALNNSGATQQTTVATEQVLATNHQTFYNQEQHLQYRPVNVMDRNGHDTYDKFIGTIDKNNGLLTGPICVDDRTGQYYRTFQDPNTGRISYNPTSLGNIQDQIQYRNPPGYCCGYRSTYGTGGISYAPNNVDKTIGIISASANGTHIITDVLENFGVVGRNDARNIHIATDGASKLSQIGAYIYNATRS